MKLYKVNGKLKSELKEKIIDESKVNIGLSWYTTNQNRFTANLNECEINILSDVSNHNLINLQYGNHQETINKNKIKYLKEIDYRKDVNEIFRIIDACDLVVTIDNCIAHFGQSERKHFCYYQLTQIGDGLIIVKKLPGTIA